MPLFRGNLKARDGEGGGRKRGRKRGELKEEGRERRRCKAHGFPFTHRRTWVEIVLPSNKRGERTYEKMMYKVSCSSTLKKIASQIKYVPSPPHTHTPPFSPRVRLCPPTLSRSFFPSPLLPRVFHHLLLFCMR